MTSVPIQGEAEAPSKFWVLLTTSLVSSLIMLDSNIVAVSLPAIGRSLKAPPSSSTSRRGGAQAASADMRINASREYFEMLSITSAVASACCSQSRN